MIVPKILVFAGSIRTGSYNARLAALAARELALAEADVTLISLADYPMALYDGDDEARSGPPAAAVRLKRLMCLQHGVFVVTPEYNASIPPLLKNTLDWVSRVREGREPPLAAFKGRVFALGAASNRTQGGAQALIALRQVLELGCGALVIPEQVALREAEQAFDEDDQLRDESAAAQLSTVVGRLVEMARVLM
jgi:chromate reductase